MPSGSETGSLAAERTLLGWQRSALSLGAVAGLMLRHGRPLDVAAGLLVGAAACAIYGRRAGTRALAAATAAAAVAAALIVAGV
jgi:uncharacterized membrane protein YidH (DUF202 family)